MENLKLILKAIYSLSANTNYVRKSDIIDLVQQQLESLEDGFIYEALEVCCELRLIEYDGECGYIVHCVLESVNQVQEEPINELAQQDLSLFITALDMETTGQALQLSAALVQELSETAMLLHEQQLVAPKERKSRKASKPIAPRTKRHRSEVLTPRSPSRKRRRTKPSTSKPKQKPAKQPRSPEKPIQRRPKRPPQKPTKRPLKKTPDRPRKEPPQPTPPRPPVRPLKPPPYTKPEPPPKKPPQPPSPRPPERPPDKPPERPPQPPPPRPLMPDPFGKSVRPRKSISRRTLNPNNSPTKLSDCSLSGNIIERTCKIMRGHKKLIREGSSVLLPKARSFHKFTQHFGHKYHYDGGRKICLKCGKHKTLKELEMDINETDQATTTSSSDSDTSKSFR